MALAAWLRLGWPGIVEFKRDEANVSILALDLAHDQNFPLLGIDSSVGIRNAPVNIYIMALPYLLSSDPILATSFVAMLNVIAVGLLYLFARRYYGVPAAIIVTLLYAASPWAVIFARKIWAQDLLPVFVVLTIGTGTFGLIEGKRWAQWLHLPLLSITGQIHYGAFVLIPVTLWLMAVGIRTKRIGRAFLGGLVLAVLLSVPYAVGLSHAGLLNISRVQQIMASNPTKPKVLTISGDAIHDAALMIAGTEIHSLAGLNEYQQYLDSVPAAYPILNILAWLVLIAAVWLVIRAIRYRDARSPLDLVAVLWLVITPLAFSLTWTALYIHYFIAMLPGAFLVVGIAVIDLWCALEPRHMLRRLLSIGGSIAVIGTTGLQSWLLIALLLFVNGHDTPGGFGTPLGYLTPLRQTILEKHPASVLANLDGQYLGFHEDATVWRALLYDVPSVRFLDGNTEVYPPQPALYLSRRCSGAAGDVYLRPPGEGCYATGQRAQANFDASQYSPINATPVTPSTTFSNGAHLIAYHWQPLFFRGQPTCFALVWVIEANPEPADYNFAVHFITSSGQEIAFADGLSWRGSYWQKGDIVVRTFCLPLNQDISAIRGVHLGMYRFVNGDSTQFHNMDLVNASGGAVGQTVTVLFPQTMIF